MNLTPTMPCTGCRLSFGGCAAKWIAVHDVCCDICQHVRQPQHDPQSSTRPARRITRIDRTN